MNYKFATIRVRDLEESIKFYSDIIGLKEAFRLNLMGSKIAFLSDENNNKIELLEFEHMKNVIPSEINPLVSIGFDVENLDETMTMVKEKKLEIILGPINTPNGGRFIYIKDPNGVEINLIEGFNV